METMTYNYQIVKTLGRIQVVSVDSIPTVGFGISKFFESPPSVRGWLFRTITIYKDGKAEDFRFNGLTFPFVYNVTECRGSDGVGGLYNFGVEFDYLDSNGELQHVKLKKMYGGGTPIDYFFKFIYNLSCCKNVDQCLDLYKYVFDNLPLRSSEYTVPQREFAIDTLKFINEFIPLLDEVKDKDFIQDLKDQINKTQKIAQDVVANTDPEIV